MKTDSNITLTLFTNLAIASGLILATACGTVLEGDVPETEDETGPFAEVRVVHGAPDAPPVDIYVAGSEEPAIAGLEYGNATAFLQVPPAAYQFEIRAAGASPTSVPVLTTDTLELFDGDRVTALAVGLLDGTGINDQFRVITYADDLDEATEGSATARLIHASPDAPTVALDLGDDGSVEYENIERFGRLGGGGVQLPAETTLPLAIFAGSPLARVTGFTLPALARGDRVTMLAVGLLGSEARADDGFGILVIPSEGDAVFVRQNPVVYVLHAGADAPPVDIDSDGVNLVSNLAFGELSAPIQLPPTDYDLQIFGAGAGGTPVASAHTPVLEAGGEYLAIATGFLAPAVGEAALEVRFLADGFELGDVHSARLRAVHASADAPDVDISPLALTGQLSTPTLVSGLRYGDSDIAEGLSVPAAALRIGIAASGSVAPVASFDISAGPGQRLYAIAAGSLFGNGRQPFRLIAIDTSGSTWSATVLSPVLTH